MSKPLLTEQILKYLDHTEKVSSLQLSTELEVEHQKVVGAIKSLQSVGEVIKADQKNESRIELTTEGELFFVVSLWFGSKVVCMCMYIKVIVIH
jgi:predicted transcriptional regulator